MDINDTLENNKEQFTFIQNKLTEIFKIEDSTKIKIYVLEKPNINIQEDKVKDGIHLILNIKMHKAEQVLLRK